MHSHLSEHDGEEVGPLVGARGDEQAAVAPPLRDELARRRPLVIDEVLGAGLEIVEHVLLVAHGPSVAPGRAVLSPAAQVGDGDDAAVTEGKDGASDGERRFQADVESCAKSRREKEKGKKARNGKKRERMKRKGEKK